jgi:hypothetical protein
MRAGLFGLSLIVGFSMSAAAMADMELNTNHAAPIAPLSGMILYHSAKMHFAIAYPPHWTVDENFTNTAVGPGKDIHGVSFTVSAARTKGTNLSPDTHLAVEMLPGACDASHFLANPQGAKTVTEAGRTYSYATATDAAAGNRYEETVYVLANTQPCVAVHYFIHYAAIENFTPGAVKKFDHDALIKTFGRMRRSLAIMK